MPINEEAMNHEVKKIKSCPVMINPCCILLHFCFTGSSLLGIICNVSPHDLLVLPYWYGSHCFIPCFTGASLQGMACVVLLPSLGYHSWAWCVLFHVILHRFLLTGREGSETIQIMHSNDEPMRHSVKH
jgi:hypothetical protein